MKTSALATAPATMVIIPVTTYKTCQRRPWRSGQTNLLLCSCNLFLFVPPTCSCLTGLVSSVWQLTIVVFICKTRLIQTSQTGGQQYSDTSPFSIPWVWHSCHTANSKPVKQEVNSTVILPPLVFPARPHPLVYSAFYVRCKLMKGRSPKRNDGENKFWNDDAQVKKGAPSRRRRGLRRQNVRRRRWPSRPRRWRLWRRWCSRATCWRSPWMKRATSGFNLIKLFVFSTQSPSKSY